MFGDVDIDGGERVIEEIDIRIRIDRTRKRDTSLKREGKSELSSRTEGGGAMEGGRKGRKEGK